MDINAIDWQPVDKMPVPLYNGIGLVLHLVKSERDLNDYQWYYTEGVLEVTQVQQWRTSDGRTIKCIGGHFDFDCEKYIKLLGWIEIPTDCSNPVIKQALNAVLEQNPKMKLVGYP